MERKGSVARKDSVARKAVSEEIVLHVAASCGHLQRAGLRSNDGYCEKEEDDGEGRGELRRRRRV